MKTYCSPDFFITNRTTLRAAVQADGPIIITGNGSMQRAADEPFKFHQDSNFWYLTGLSTPDLVLIIGKSETYIIAPTLSFVRAAFDGAHDVQAFVATSGITNIYDERTGWQKVRVELQAVHRVNTLASAPAHMKRHGLFSLPFRRRLIAKLKRLDSQLSINDIRPLLAYQRSIKQPQELAAMQKAIDITTETLAEVRTQTFLQRVTHEYHMEAAISYGFRTRGADGHAFDPIVAGGVHATTLHHLENNGRVRQDDLIVVDIGAAVEHYAADISRTISGSPLVGRKAAVFDAVLDVQKYALKQLKPGIAPYDYEKLIEKYMGEKLCELGVIKVANSKNIRRYYPHATSHFLGLDAHDAGDYQKPYEPNMVVTCEPGIYIPEEGIGVRIEDDVLLQPNGNIVMSAACSRKAF